MIVKLLRLLRGYIIFTAIGGFGERFINLAASKRLNIWDVSCSKDAIKAKITINNFYKLRNVARKTGVKIKILKKWQKSLSRGENVEN